MRAAIFHGPKDIGARAIKSLVRVGTV